jgi:hypothetical protein
MQQGCDAKSARRHNGSGCPEVHRTAVAGRPYRNTDRHQTPETSMPALPICGIAEIVLSVRDLPTMRSFHEA